MQNLCYDSMVELNVWDDFQVNCTHPAKELDSLSSSHPIEVVVNNPSDIDEIFDTISYKKVCIYNIFFYYICTLCVFYLKGSFDNFHAARLVRRYQIQVRIVWILGKIFIRKR
jgi:hypothetical protein